MSAGRPGSKSRSSPSSSASSGWSSTPRPSPPPRRSRDTPRRGTPVRPRIAENGRVLLESYRVLARAIKDERAITPAAEWLVDNFHIVDEQLREIRDDLPAGLLPRAPEARRGPSRRLPARPRASPGRTSPTPTAGSTRRACGGWCAPTRRSQPLTIGELWAIAISLRILLVENLRRLAEQIVRSRAARQKADELADGLLGLGPDGPEAAAAALRRLSTRDARRPRRGSSCSSACAIRIPRSPRRSAGWRSASPPRAPPPRRSVRVEHQRQATMNVTVRNVITSMRLISWFDWAAVRRERQPRRRGPSRAEARSATMDFATRDRYRHADRGAGPRARALTEVDVARRAAAMADASSLAERRATVACRADAGIPATT